ncbi:MAG: glycosyltransferase family 39 protein [Candidatus Pacebacteria bacterium]|nr:glycosyltransferase family 39 protein [Candidatus Paceibacterota bacterium]
MKNFRATLLHFLNECRDNAFHARVRGILFGNHAGPVLLLLLVACISAYLRVNYIPLVVNSDTTQYIQTAQYLAEDPAGIAHGNRLLKPLAPMGMAVLAPYFDGNYATALEVLSIVCYLLLTIVIYFFAYHFLTSRFEAFCATLLYSTSYPMLMYGLDLYTETGAWLFHLLGLYYAVRYYRTPYLKYVTLSALTTTVGFLWKEYAALSGLALGLLILLAHTPWKTKLGHLAVAGVLALPILIGWQVHVYQVYDYSYLDWFITGHGEPEATSQYSLFYIVKSMFALFLGGWFLVMSGMYLWRTFTREDRVPGMIAIFTSLGFLAWGYVSSRLYFVLAPMLAVFAGRGTRILSKRTTQITLVILIVSMNYTWLFVANTPAIRAWLVAL